MTTFEAIYLMLTFGTFFIAALLAYIDRNHKHKKIAAPDFDEFGLAAICSNEANHYVGGCSLYVFTI